MSTAAGSSWSNRYAWGIGSGRYGWLRVCEISRYPAIVLFELDGVRWPCRLCPLVPVGPDGICSSSSADALVIRSFTNLWRLAVLLFI
jgi:hypothetical protein